MRYLMLAVIVGATLAIPSSANACHRRSSCHGCYGSGCHGGSGCNGSRCFGSGSRCFGSRCHGSSACHGSWGSGCAGGGYRTAWGGGYSNGYAYYPSTNYTDGTVSRTSAYYDANGNVISAQRAIVDIVVPDANTDLFIQDQKMTPVGTVRSFYSPDLEQGKVFTYTLKIKRNGAADETRTVQVQSGTRVTVDFTQPKPGALQSPEGNIENKPRPVDSRPDTNPIKDGSGSSIPK